MVRIFLIPFIGFFIIGWKKCVSSDSRGGSSSRNGTSDRGVEVSFLLVLIFRVNDGLSR